MKLAAAVLVFASSAHADTLSFDPVMGALGFTGKQVGDWSFTYERALGPQHAVVAEQATVHVHEPPFHLTMFSLAAGYRYFLRDARSTPFVGVFAGGKLGTGRYGHDHAAHAAEGESLSATGIYATAHAGWRFTRGRLVLTARVGAGIAAYDVDGPDGVDVMAEDHLEPLPFEVDTELSIGVAF